jgi:hypothetical protein
MTIKTLDRLRRSLRLAVRPSALVWSILYSSIASLASLKAGILDIGSPFWILTMATLLVLLPLYDGVFISSLVAGVERRRASTPSSMGARRRQVFDRVAASFPRLLVGQLLVATGVFIGSLLILPGIYFGIRASLYRQAIVLDGASPVAAIRESFRRVADPRVFVTILVALMVWVGVEIGLEELLFWSGAGAGPSLAVLVPASGFLLAVLNAWLTLLYRETGPLAVDGSGETA